MDKLIIDRSRNIVSMAKGLIGSTAFRHLYTVDGSGRQIDTMHGGTHACARVVSSVLALNGLLDGPHCTIKSTLEAMDNNGWIEHPWDEGGKISLGGIAVWDSVPCQGEDGCRHTDHRHLGIFCGEDTFVSNSRYLTAPAEHTATLRDGRVPVIFYNHPELSSLPSLELPDTEHYGKSAPGV